MDQTEHDLMVTRNSELAEEVLEHRKSLELTILQKTVPEINTLLSEFHNIGTDVVHRTVLMYLVDSILSMVTRIRGNGTATTPADKTFMKDICTRLRLLLHVFPPKYTNVFIQDTDTNSLLGRMQKMMMNSDYSHRTSTKVS
jgi:hypothetical protein